VYQFRLWVDLGESTDEADCGQLAEKLRVVQRVIDDKLTMIRHPKECISVVNYATVLQCSGGANHRGAIHDALMEVLHLVAKLLPGSHGLVYWTDDEGAQRNAYSVIVIARGQLHDLPDPFLSPIVPTVAD